MAINRINAYLQDWNPCTVEAYDPLKKEVTMIFNFDITMQNKTDNVIHYVVGRLMWGCNNFPDSAKIILSFDIRGQNIIVLRSQALKDFIMQYVKNLNITNEIAIEFFR